MKLINELINGWDIEALEAELDQIEEEYRNLVNYTSLFEGVLDTLPDDVIQKVTEIEKRLDAVARARVLLTRLKTTGGYSPEKIKKMRARVTRNAAKLKNLLGQTKIELEKIGDKIEDEVKKVKADDESGGAEDGVHLRSLPAQTVLVLSKIAKGEFNPDQLDDDKAMEILGDLESLGLIDNNDKITAKGKQSLANLKKRGQFRRSGGDEARQSRLDREELTDVEA